ncbi:MAG: fructosamine kinase family protein [Spirochaetales bacterium]|nr:fructosamine kinase family protein [Spirochaetales bacterium]
MNFSSVIGEKILESRPVGGGCIGSCFRVRTKVREYFVKFYSKPGVSVKEAHGLKELSISRTVKVPELINYDEQFLVLGFINQAPRADDFQTRLAGNLAALHKTISSEYGFYEDNIIGSTPQKNSWKNDWIDFYIENRLDFQVGLAADHDINKAYDRLRGRIPEILGDSIEPPCLIHGDLWSGNVISGEDGGPVLIDPAPYYGHRELELAMTQLFGGFSAEFYSIYDKEYPLKKGWRDRQDLYKLYHVLNHLNLFGNSYKHQALSLMKAY